MAGAFTKSLGITISSPPHTLRFGTSCSVVVKARKPSLLQVTTLMNKVKKVLGITRVKQLVKKIKIIH